MFACNQDVRIRRPHSGDGLEHGLHLWGCSNELWAPLSLEQAILGGEPFRALQCSTKVNLSPQDGEQPLVLPWLLNEVARSTAHGLNSKFNVGPGRHDNDWNGVVERYDFRKEVESFLSRRGVARVVQ